MYFWCCRAIFWSPHLSFLPCRQIQSTIPWDLSVQWSHEWDKYGWENERALEKVLFQRSTCTQLEQEGQLMCSLCYADQQSFLLSLFTHLNFFTTRNTVLRVQGDNSREKAPHCLYTYLCFVLINPCSQESQHVRGSLWEFTCERHQQINMACYRLKNFIYFITGIMQNT